MSFIQLAPNTAINTLAEIIATLSSAYTTSNNVVVFNTFRFNGDIGTLVPSYSNSLSLVSNPFYTRSIWDSTGSSGGQGGGSGFIYTLSGAGGNLSTAMNLAGTPDPSAANYFESILAVEYSNITSPDSYSYNSTISGTFSNNNDLSTSNLVTAGDLIVLFATDALGGVIPVTAPGFTVRINSGGILLADMVAPSTAVYTVTFPTLGNRTPSTDYGQLSVWIGAFNYFNAPVLGNIIVQKVAVPASQKFNFTPSWGSAYLLGNGESNDSGPLAAGTYNIVEESIPGWNTVVSQDPTNITVNDGETTNIIFTNTFVSPVPPNPTDLIGKTLTGDFSEGIGKVKWDPWTYVNNLRLLSSGKLTKVVNILDTGKIIALDENQVQDYVDGTSLSPIYHYALTAGFTDEEDMVNILYAIVIRAIGEGLIHVSAMQMDDEFNVNPVNQVNCVPQILNTTPGKVYQFIPKFQGEKWYLLFEAQVQIENDDADVGAWFRISRLFLYSTTEFAERPA